MGLFNPAEIPGYADALAKESQLRDLTFLNYPLPLCGVKVRQFTPRHLILLEHCDNAFICGRAPDLEDILVFMWIVSTDYCLDQTARDAWLKSWMKNAADLKVVPAIKEYLDAAFYDSPAMGGGVHGKSYTASIAVVVDIIAVEYGWDDESILEKPLARIFQYLRRIERRKNPKAIQFNRSDKAISDWAARMQSTGGN